MKKKINKYDIGLIAAIIIINIFLIIYGGRTALASNSKIAYIQSKNEYVREYVLTQDVKDEFTIETEMGYNTVYIENGQIWIHEASCPDKICIQQGKISRNNEAILCIPNRLFIKIIDDKDDSEIDFIAD